MMKGQVLATREGGDELIYDHTDANGIDWGYVQRGGEKFPLTPVISIIARGYWQAS